MLNLSYISNLEKTSQQSFLFINCCVLLVLEIEPRASCTIGKCCTQAVPHPLVLCCIRTASTLVCGHSSLTKNTVLSDLQSEEHESFHIKVFCADFTTALCFSTAAFNSSYT